MGILGQIKPQKRRFCVGGREVLCIDAELPTGQSPAAAHILNLIQRLSAYAEQTLLPLAAAALTDAVGMGQGHRFSKHVYRISVQEAPERKRRRVTLNVRFFFFDARSGERIEQCRVLETLWDASGTLQLTNKQERREGRS